MKIIKNANDINNINETKIMGKNYLIGLKSPLHKIKMYYEVSKQNHILHFISALLSNGKNIPIFCFIIICHLEKSINENTQEILSTYSSCGWQVVNNLCKNRSCCHLLESQTPYSLVSCNNDLERVDNLWIIYNIFTSFSSLNVSYYIYVLFKYLFQDYPSVYTSK